ncbi:MAG TPA: hypothetical protein VLT45_16655 [Kofleriaceae bacterium]|nr:hypothetical protein [Kofleriaceae bacterium]
MPRGYRASGENWVVKDWRNADSCQAIRHPPVADLHDGTRGYGIGSTIVMRQVMRNVLLAFASLAAVSSVASAEPLSVAATTDDAATPATYVQGGVTAGGNDGLLTAGASAEVGRRVAPFAWVHASLMMGAANEIFAHGSGSIVQARGGVDLMTCSGNGVLCAFAGADIGLQASQYHGSEDPWFCDSDAGDCMSTPVDDSHAGVIGVGRVGLDIGGTHVRWRPGIEASMSTDGHAGLSLTQSLAYRF